MSLSPGFDSRTRNIIIDMCTYILIWRMICVYENILLWCMHSVGFEPTHPKILRPERSALDRSAILTSKVVCDKASSDFNPEEHPHFSGQTPKTQGPTEIRTRIAGFKVQSANHYTIGPSLCLVA